VSKLSVDLLDFLNVNFVVAKALENIHAPARPTGQERAVGAVEITV